MIIIGAENLEALNLGRVSDMKMVFNAQGAMIFSARHQHREMKIDGISYEDNYAGTALAAMIRRDEIEVRFHSSFADREVARIITDLLSHPDLSTLANAHVTYQGRPIKV